MKSFRVPFGEPGQELPRISCLTRSWRTDVQEGTGPTIPAGEVTSKPFPAADFSLQVDVRSQILLGRKIKYPAKRPTEMTAGISER